MTGDPAGTLSALGAAGRTLSGMSLAERAARISAACAQWRQREWPPRAEAEASLASAHAVPPDAIAPVLDTFFGAWTEDGIIGWAASDLGDARALDRLARAGTARRRAVAPRLAACIGAHGVPTTPVADILSALVVGSPIWLKPASSSDDLAHIFATALVASDPELGEAVTVAEWREKQDRVIAASDVVIVTGGDEAIEALRAATPASTRVVEHGARLSAAFVDSTLLEEDRDRVLADLARDTAFAGQLGCLSPVVAYVEASFETVASLVEPLLEACHAIWPAPARRVATTATAGAFSSYAAELEIERAAGRPVAHAGDDTDAWTIVARDEARAPSAPPVPRHLTLYRVGGVEEAARRLEARRGTIATVGIAVGRSEDVSESLAAAGVERVAKLGAMQRPPLDWRRDGRPTLNDLVRWVDFDGV